MIPLEDNRISDATVEATSINHLEEIREHLVTRKENIQRTGSAHSCHTESLWLCMPPTGHFAWRLSCKDCIYQPKTIL